MAVLATDPNTPTSKRISTFADALDLEGHPLRARAVRQIGREYARSLGEGDVVGAIAAFASLDVYRERLPSEPREGGRTPASTLPLGGGRGQGAGSSAA